MAEVAKKGIADLLATKNHHPRDDRIIFDEDAHTYTVDGEIYPTSVSGIVHSLFPQFDAEEVIAKNFDKWKDNKQSPYYRYIQYAELRMHLNESLQRRGMPLAILAPSMEPQSTFQPSCS